MKYLLSIIFLTFTLLPSALCQTEKGNYMLGSSINFIGGYSNIVPNQVSFGFGKNKLSNLQVDYTNLNLSSNGGYFVANGLMFGLNVGVFHNTTDFKLKREEPLRDTTWNEKFTVFSVTPTIRYYLNQGSKIQYFGEGRGGLSVQKLSDDNATENIVVGAKVGAALFLNSKVALDVFVDFTGGFSERKINNLDTKVFDSIMGFGFAFDIFL